MAQRGRRPRFLLEAAQAIGIGREDVGQDLDRDVAAEPRVMGAIDLSHAAAANQRQDVVGTKPRTRGQ